MSGTKAAHVFPHSCCNVHKVGCRLAMRRRMGSTSPDFAASWLVHGDPNEKRDNVVDRHEASGPRSLALLLRQGRREARRKADKNFMQVSTLPDIGGGNSPYRAFPLVLPPLYPVACPRQPASTRWGLSCHCLASLLERRAGKNVSVFSVFSRSRSSGQGGRPRREAERHRWVIALLRYRILPSAGPPSTPA